MRVWNAKKTPIVETGFTVTWNCANQDLSKGPLVTLIPNASLTYVEATMYANAKTTLTVPIPSSAALQFSVPISVWSVKTTMIAGVGPTAPMSCALTN